MPIQWIKVTGTKVCIRVTNLCITIIMCMQAEADTRAQVPLDFTSLYLKMSRSTMAASFSVTGACVVDVND